MSDTTTTEKSPTEKETVARARALAARDLRNKYRKEHDDLVKQHAKAMGVDWSPRPTKEERAQAELERLLAENPTLAAQYQKVQHEG